MRLIRQLYLRWVLRNASQAEMAKLLDAYMMAARRCAYDLAHANSLISHRGNERMVKLFAERQDMWIKMFNPTGVKNYYTETSREIDALEKEVTKCHALLKEHNLWFDDDLPF